MDPDYDSDYVAHSFMNLSILLSILFFFCLIFICVCGYRYHAPRAAANYQAAAQAAPGNIELMPVVDSNYGVDEVNDVDEGNGGDEGSGGDEENGGDEVNGAGR